MEHIQSKLSSILSRKSAEGNVFLDFKTKWAMMLSFHFELEFIGLGSTELSNRANRCSVCGRCSILSNNFESSKLGGYLQAVPIRWRTQHVLFWNFLTGTHHKTEELARAQTKLFGPGVTPGGEIGRTYTRIAVARLATIVGPKLCLSTMRRLLDTSWLAGPVPTHLDCLHKHDVSTVRFSWLRPLQDVRSFPKLVPNGNSGNTLERARPAQPCGHDHTDPVGAVKRLIAADRNKYTPAEQKKMVRDAQYQLARQNAGYCNRCYDENMIGLDSISSDVFYLDNKVIDTWPQLHIEVGYYAAEMCQEAKLGSKILIITVTKSITPDICGTSWFQSFDYCIVITAETNGTDELYRNTTSFHVPLNATGAMISKVGYAFLECWPEGYILTLKNANFRPEELSAPHFQPNALIPLIKYIGNERWEDSDEDWSVLSGWLPGLLIHPYRIWTKLRNVPGLNTLVNLRFGTPLLQVIEPLEDLSPVNWPRRINSVLLKEVQIVANTSKYVFLMEMSAGIQTSELPVRPILELDSPKDLEVRRMEINGKGFQRVIMLAKEEGTSWALEESDIDEHAARSLVYQTAHLSAALSFEQRSALDRVEFKPSNANMPPLRVLLGKGATSFVAIREGKWDYDANRIVFSAKAIPNAESRSFAQVATGPDEEHDIVEGSTTPRLGGKTLQDRRGPTLASIIGSSNLSDFEVHSLKSRQKGKAKETISDDVDVDAVTAKTSIVTPTVIQIVAVNPQLNPALARETLRQFSSLASWTREAFARSILNTVKFSWGRARGIEVNYTKPHMPPVAKPYVEGKINGMTGVSAWLDNTTSKFDTILSDLYLLPILLYGRSVDATYSYIAPCTLRTLSEEQIDILWRTISLLYTYGYSSIDAIQELVRNDAEPSTSHIICILTYAYLWLARAHFPLHETSKHQVVLQVFKRLGEIAYGHHPYEMFLDSYSLLRSETRGTEHMEFSCLEDSLFGILTTLGLSPPLLYEGRDTSRFYREPLGNSTLVNLVESRTKGKVPILPFENSGVSLDRFECLDI